MKEKLFFLACLLMSFNPAQASDGFNDPAVTVYWQLPLGSGHTGKNNHMFGLRLDQTVHDNTGNLVSSFSAPLKPALINLRFNNRGMDGLYMNGVNMASPIMFEAAEGSGGGWAILGGAALAVVGVAIQSHAQKMTPAASTNPVTVQSQAPDGIY